MNIPLKAAFTAVGLAVGGLVTWVVVDSQRSGASPNVSADEATTSKPSAAYVRRPNPFLAFNGPAAPAAPAPATYPGVMITANDPMAPYKAMDELMNTDKFARRMEARANRPPLTAEQQQQRKQWRQQLRALPEDQRKAVRKECRKRRGADAGFDCSGLLADAALYVGHATTKTSESNDESRKRRRDRDNDS